MGDIATRVTAPAMAQAKNNRLAAVMRRDLNRAKELALECGAPKAYGTVKEVLEDDGPVPVTGQDGIMVSRIIAAAYESAKEGTAISIR